MVDAKGLENKLCEAFPQSQIIIKDISGGCGSSFDLVIISDKFNNKTLLQRHRLVNEILKEELKDIHALTMKTYTIKEGADKL